MDIYSILSSKPHNPHYLNRYITFIKQCQQKNVGYEGYTEDHHICPKADDMFPEYKDFHQHPWNCATLTPRQHFIAHIILYKCYEHFISVNISLNMMSNFSKYSNYSKKYEKMRKIFSSKISEMNSNKVVCRDQYTGKVYSVDKEIFDSSDNLIGVMKNKSVVKNLDGNVIVIDIEQFDGNIHESIRKNRYKAKDQYGNNFYIYENDPRIESGELKFTTKNKEKTYKFSDNNGKIFFLPKDSELIQEYDLSPHKNNLIPVKDFFGNFYSVHKSDPRLKTGELVHNTKGLVSVKDESGNTFTISNQHPDYLSGKYVSVNKGMVRVKDKNGKSFYVDKKDPRYISGELVFWSVGMVPVKDSKGNTFCVDKNDMRLKTGELISASKGIMLESRRITNGKQNKTIKKEEEIPAGWWLGISGKTTRGTTMYNNGKINKRFGPNDKIPLGWVKGQLKKK